MSNKPKIITFENKRSKKINDREIAALFMGLLKIVKKYALEDAEYNCREEINLANQNFRECLKDLTATEQKLKIEVDKNFQLERRSQNLEAQLCALLESREKSK